MTLSKSQYIRGLQCPKSLWLHKHKPELKDTPDEQTEWILKTGDRVGEFAKGLFPDGVEIAFDSSDFDGMVAKTKALIESGTEVIYEAAFKEKGIFVMVDLLVKNGAFWDIYEVKSSAKVKEYQLNDAAIQWYALCDVLDLNRAFIVHIDTNYVRGAELDVDALFKIVDVTATVRQKQDTIEKNLQAFESILDAEMPDTDIGAHCTDPHVCDFYGHCWAHIPDFSIFDLYRMNGQKKFEMYQQGIVDLEDIPQEMKLNATQALQVSTVKTQKPHIDVSVIKAFTERVRYPINFFDFETFQDAVPRFEGQKPFEQIPFQYSLHILHEDGKLEHREFLADENEDPREPLIKQMLHDITGTGSIVAYNQGFEKGVIKGLSKHYPAYAKALLKLNERFVDLIEPFRKRGYYHPDFNGSFSLKSVLPALFPDDAELDYKQLGSVQNGGHAMHTFANLHLLEDKSLREQIRADLLAYCRLDTLAMVRIWERLKSISK